MPCHVPAVAVVARGLVDRQAAEVARLLAGHAIRLILVIPAAPVADEADLRRSRRSHREQGRQQDYPTDRRSHHSAPPRLRGSWLSSAGIIGPAFSISCSADVR